MSFLCCFLRTGDASSSSSAGKGKDKGKGKEKEVIIDKGKGKEKEERLPQRAFPFEFAYVDGWLLADELDKIYGPGQYELESSNDRYILRAPRDLTQPERTQLLERARAHYPERLSSDSSDSS